GEEPTRGRTLPPLVRAVAAVAAVLLVGFVLRLAGDETTQPESAATQAPPPQAPSTAFGPPPGVAGPRACPGGLPRAPSTGSRASPPNQPDHPEPTIKPEACFATGPDARAAGYSEAIVVGSRTVEGVYLVPIPAPQDRCRLAADLLGFSVPCPTLLPNQAYGA